MSDDLSTQLQREEKISVPRLRAFLDLEPELLCYGECL